MTGWKRAMPLLAVALLAGCRSDRAPDGKPSVSTAATEATASSSLPSWAPVPTQIADGDWVARELARDDGAARAWDELADVSAKGRAAWALGRVGGAAARDRLATIVADPKTPSTALVALAFLDPPASAPGEPSEPEGAWAELEDALWTRYAVTEDDDIAGAIQLAVSRVGGSRSVVRLAADTEVLPSKGQEARYERGLEAMGILCARGFGLPRSALRSVAQGLQADAGPVKSAAAYTLGRCAAPSAEQIAGEERSRLVELVVPLVGTDDPDLARLGWKALAGLGEVPGEIGPEILGSSPPPWLVEVAAVQALVGHADGREVVTQRLAALPRTAIDDTRVHVVLVALRGLRDAVGGSPEIQQRIRTFAGMVAGARAVASGRDKKRLALVGCELAVLAAIADGEIETVERCGDGVDGLPAWFGNTLVVEAVLRAGAALTKEKKLAALLERARDERPQVAASALSALADVDDPAVNPVLREAMMRDDVGVAAAAASSIAARAVDGSRRDPQAVDPLRQAIARLPNEAAVEARIAAIEALGSLARSATKAAEVEAAAQWLEQTVLPLASDPNPAVARVAREALLSQTGLVQRFDQAAVASGSVSAEVEAARGDPSNAVSGLRLETDAGDIVVEFDGAPAPVMQAVLAKLARDGFYDGLTTHRIVPGFVVQGGDPHGDGYGGPGFIVPCERSPLRYERGTVGIALAGKDTGGSQFFVTQTRQPHLDARYTVVGRVTEGMDAVDRLLPHDRIRRVSVLTED